MTIQRVAQVFGVVFVLVALVGFFTPGGMGMDASMEGAPHLLGLFPVNLLHNLVHLVFGVWGLLAGRAASSARSYCRGAGIIYVVLAGLGFVTPTTFGLIPIGGHDIWLHALLGIILVAVGFSGGKAASPAPA